MYPTLTIYTRSSTVLRSSRYPARLRLLRLRLPPVMASQRTSSTSAPGPATDRGSLPSDIAASIAEGGPTAASTEAYLASKLIIPKGNFAGDESLEKSRQRALDAGIPAIEVSPLQGQFLSILAKSIGATKILEIGTLWGYSTVFFTRALPPSGLIDTLEISPEHAKVAQQTFLEADLYPFPKIHVGPALDTLKTLVPPGTTDGLPDAGYDLVFIDANKDQIDDYFREALRLTRKGGLIIVDNAVRRGGIVPTEGKAPSQFEEESVGGLRRLYDWIQKDAGKTVLATGLQTVGAKFWDGYCIATKL